MRWIRKIVTGYLVRASIEAGIEDRASHDRLCCSLPDCEYHKAEILFTLHRALRSLGRIPVIGSKDVCDQVAVSYQDALGVDLEMIYTRFFTR